MGGRIVFSNIAVNTTEGETYTAGAKDPDSSFKTVNKSVGSVTNRLNLGVTFNPTDNLSFEATVGGGSITTGRLSVFEPNASGLFNFTHILVSVKF